MCILAIFHSMRAVTQAVMHETGRLEDLRKSIRGGYADFKRGREDKAVAEDDDEDEVPEPRSTFSYAAAMKELATEEQTKQAETGVEL